MAETKHTPGPWVADESTGGGIFGPDGTAIQTAGPHALDDDGSGWANARLIAAAPDLLDSVKSLLSMFRDDRHGPSCAPGQCCCIFGLARERIAKAEGR